MKRNVDQMFFLKAEVFSLKEIVLPVNCYHCNYKRNAEKELTDYQNISIGKARTDLFPFKVRNNRSLIFGKNYNRIVA